MALAILDREIPDLTTPSKELTLLNVFYDAALAICINAYDFPFLVKRTTLTEDSLLLTDDGLHQTYREFYYGYSLPNDISRVVRVNENAEAGYAVRFGSLWCNVENPTIEYIENYLEEDVAGDYLAPKNFVALVAYQLALHVAPKLAPQSEAQSIAAQLYQLTLSSIITAEVRNNDIPSNHGADYEWGDEPDFDIYDYRRELFEDR